MACVKVEEIKLNNNIDIIKNMPLVRIQCKKYLLNLKFNNNIDFNDNMYFLFHIYFVLLESIENGIEIIFSGNYKSAMIREHPNYKKGYTFCVLSLKIIKQIVLEESKIYLNNPPLINKKILENGDLHLHFFHITEERKMQFDTIYTLLLNENKLNEAKKINTRMYLYMLDILTPPNILLIFINLYEFHKILQANRYLNKLVSKDENPICLPYVFKNT
jgi:hypothetical protein